MGLIAGGQGKQPSTAGVPFDRLGSGVAGDPSEGPYGETKDCIASESGSSG